MFDTLYRRELLYLPVRYDLNQFYAGFFYQILKWNYADDRNTLEYTLMVKHYRFCVCLFFVCLFVCFFFFLVLFFILSKYCNTNRVFYFKTLHIFRIFLKSGSTLLPEYFIH